MNYTYSVMTMSSDHNYEIGDTSPDNGNGEHHIPNKQEHSDVDTKASTSLDAEKDSKDNEDNKDSMVDQENSDIMSDPALSPISNILSSLAQRAKLDSGRNMFKTMISTVSSASSCRSTDEVEPPLPRFIQESASRHEAVQELIETYGAEWQDLVTVQVERAHPKALSKDLHLITPVVVHRLANVKYGNESNRQSMDFYFADPPQPTNHNNEIDDEDDSNSIIDEEQEKEEEAQHYTTNNLNEINAFDDFTNNDAIYNKPKKSVFIHIHGGGWSRGRKDSLFYGGPAMCQHAAAYQGCLAVAIGYRLGAYPDFVWDVARAIQFVLNHIETLGGDLEQVYLSGHSAGGHIASLLTLRHAEFLAPLGIPRDFCRGLILVSGVYDLFQPMRKNPLDAKNKWFQLCYVTPAFGVNRQLKREASPLLILKPEKDTSLMGTGILAVSRKVQEQLGSSSRRWQDSLTPKLPFLTPKPICCTDTSAMPVVEATEDEAVSDNDDHNLVKDEEKEESQQQPALDLTDVHFPPTLILNATFDMGLQENGELMAQALRDHTRVKYQIIEGSDHASICWNGTTARVMAQFIQELERVVDVDLAPTTANDNGDLSQDNKQRTKRRGKRDKSTKATTAVPDATAKDCND